MRRARLRRHIATSMITAVVAAGLATASPAAAAPVLVRNTTSSLGGWGVTGIDTTTSPVAGFKSNVTALAEWNDRIYVGGMFTQVANRGTPRANQPFLAAFDRATGTWVGTFRPVLDGGVWDLAVTADGKLMVGGYFARVNGATHRGLVALDPTTGATLDTWQVALTNTVFSGARAGVRTMHINGSWIYIGGNITQVSGGTGTDTGTVRGKNLFRVRVTNGRPSGTFKPTLSTAPWQVHASRLGDRVYAAGKFGTVNGVHQEVTAVLAVPSGALVPGLNDVRPSYDCRPTCRNPTYAPYAQAIYETADASHVVAAPTEHALQFLRRDTLAREYGHITLRGGDFQAITESQGVIYAACHCFNNNYSGAWVYRGTSTPPPSYDGVHPINGVGAYDATTLRKLDAFQPLAYGSLGDGVWQLMVDSRNCLWMGGDLTHTTSTGWLGGIAKFCP